MTWIDWYNELPADQKSDPWFILAALLRYLDKIEAPTPEPDEEDS